ncbi:MAG TPA: ABC transporter permease [Pyrinomonadaceae bacterium]|nr:ABC transporter permease [Pyrinomonadaceae bacterium]
MITTDQRNFFLVRYVLLGGNLRLGLRSLRKNPAYALVAITILALGIGATTAIFSVVNSVLLRPLPFRVPDQLVWIWSRRPDNNRAPFSLPDFLDHRDQNQTLAQVAAFGNTGLSLSGVERTDRIQAVRVSANLFQLLGVEAAHGRLMLPTDDEPSQRHVVVLTNECWQRRFGSDPQIVGKSLTLNSESYQVIGITPVDYSLPNPLAELAIPLAPDVDPLRTERGSVNFLRLIGRLKQGVTIDQAEADLTAIVTHERQQFGDLYLKKTGINLVSLHEELVGPTRAKLWVLFGAVTLVLLIGCCNLAALSLTRAAGRSHEIAIRKALGATSGRLISQLLTESLILATIGGVCGLFLAMLGVRALLFLNSAPIPRQQEIGIDLRVLAFAIGSSLVSAVIFGILPAWQGARADANGALRSSTRGAGDAARLNRWRSILVMGEVAISFMLLIGTGLLIQSFAIVQAVQPGFDPSNTLAVRVSLPKSHFENREAVALFDNKLAAALTAMPGVEAAGAVSILPMSGGGNTIQFSIASQETSVHDKHSANYRVATPEYFRAMKIPLLQGRLFDDHDRGDTVPVALINENLARRLWPNRNAIGEQLRVDDNNTGPRPIEIAGVVGDVRQESLEADPVFDIYIPMAQVHADNVDSITNSHYWLIRSHVPQHSLETAFLSELQKIYRDAATSNIRTMNDFLSDSVAPRKFSLRLLTIFSAVALLLAVTGIYGTVSYSVRQRTPELGVRLALGAQHAQVFRLILGQGLKVIVLGLAIGVVGAFALSRVIRGLLFNITPTDQLTFLLVSALLLVVATVAAGLPARRATKVNPLIALRNE